jgi:carbonic anhydrase
MSLKKYVFILISLFLSKMTFSENVDKKLPPHSKDSIEQIEMHDQLYIKKKGAAFFKKMSSGQHPLFTIVSCSDSRVQTNILDDNPEGNFFVVRNIGNQLATSLGSVDYGVSHLNTEVLLIIGHSLCGAIETVIKGYKDLEPDIVKELDSIRLSPGVTEIAGAQQNVHNQVAIAVQKYAQKIKDNRLIIVGAIYDFANEMHHGSGELLIINVNGETNSAKIKQIIDIKMSSLP